MELEVLNNSDIEVLNDTDQNSSTAKPFIQENTIESSLEEI